MGARGCPRAARARDRRRAGVRRHRRGGRLAAEEDLLPTVRIDSYDDRFDDVGDHAVVAIDVLRATTTAVTAVALGRRCFPVSSLDAAVERARLTEGALLVGELGGNMPYGFDLTNSPAALAAREDVERPVILLSSSGTPLLCDAPSFAGEVYVACLRNEAAVAKAVAARRASVVLLGAATRGEFREEDQLCCAWIAARLFDDGYDADDEQTEKLVERWRGRPVEAITSSNSVRYLRDTGQLRDLDFVLEHVDDLSKVFRIASVEVVEA
jgi:2-phosphosulfolactate phosphatase